MTHPTFALAWVLAVFFVLPRFGSAATVASCAAMLSALVAGQPERFRTRRGSLRLAIGLVVAMWIAAAVIAALTLAGELRD